MYIPSHRLNGYPDRRASIRGVTLCLFLAVLVSMASPGRARASGDRVAWMAKRLISGSGILDYELALKRFVTISDPRVLPTLMKLTESPRPQARAAAAGVLYFYNNDKSRKKLVEMIDDPSGLVKVAAAKSLCLMKYTANLKHVAEGCKSRDEEVRASALRALAQINDEASKTSLQSLPAPKSSFDRIWFAFARYQMDIDRQKQLDVLQKHLLDLPKRAWLPGKDDPDKRDLERAARLAEKDQHSRLQAADALSRIGDESALRLLVQGTGDIGLSADRRGPRTLLRRHGDKAVEAVAAGLGDEKTLVRLGCAVAARRLRPVSETARSKLGSGLGKALGDDSRFVRLAAARAIASLGLGDRRPEMHKALSHPDSRTRRAVARALGHMDESLSSVEALIEHLKTEKNISVRRGIYRALTSLGSNAAVEPLFGRLKKLHDSHDDLSVRDEIALCVEALGSAGDLAARRATNLMQKTKGSERKLLVEVLAHTGSARALVFFLDRLRETPPDPDGPEVRFFDSLDKSMVPKLEKMIEDETAMWIRMIIARNLFRMGKREYARGVTWGLRHDDVYMRRLAAAISTGVNVPESTEPLIELLKNEPRTARFAARALLDNQTPRAIEGLLQALHGESFRRRLEPPLTPFWEGRHSASHPFSKEVDNDRVWVVFAENRMGRNMDLFLTWSIDGRVWKRPAFTGLTSFSAPQAEVPPPTFSLKVRGRDITIALTHTFARSSNPERPRLKTVQRVHRFELSDFFSDRDEDELPDLEEKAVFTNSRRADTDRDGMNDNEDKNPRAEPPNLDRDRDILKVLAFSYALLVREIIPPRTRLLVVHSPPGKRSIPEMAVFPWLVLHLDKEQIRSLWRSTGGGFPQVYFDEPEIESSGEKARQVFEVRMGPDDDERFEVTFGKKDDRWLVRSFVDSIPEESS